MSQRISGDEDVSHADQSDTDQESIEEASNAGPHTPVVNDDNKCAPEPPQPTTSFHSCKRQRLTFSETSYFLPHFHSLPINVSETNV
jgi:hypothetical protein